MMCLYLGSNIILIITLLNEKTELSIKKSPIKRINKMHIREATHNDTPQILKVLKASLGETSSKKTEEVWRYKHIENPFGESLVLVAEESGEIIGVRAFMRWQWQKGEKIFSAYRAVDTATHPSHQGKGVFKKLTLKALEMGKERGDHFVFNTPNSKSRPGYLKMGWKEVNSLKIYLYPKNPFSFQKHKYTLPYKSNDIEYSKFEKLTEAHNIIEIKRNKFFTPKSAEYLSWRYGNNPLQKYRAVGDEDFFIAFYVKKHKRLSELRIAEHVFNNSRGLIKLQQFIKLYSRQLRVQIITSSRELGLSRMRLSGRYGPILTIREVDSLECFSETLNLENWCYSIGDFELF